MKNWHVKILAGIALILSGCCHCDEEHPVIWAKFENFPTEELKTFYIVDNGSQDTCFNCVDTISHEAYFFPVSTASQFQLKSDSIPLTRVIKNIKIKSKETGFLLCDCYKITQINYESDGKRYTNEPLVITK
ncbi:MAG TPA: hypothetical protein VK927_01970 [Adhaeribacter sp.]|nr:hypothetical protein [Adhaeribacter sp.]